MSYPCVYQQLRPTENGFYECKTYVKVFRLPKKPADMKVWIRELPCRDLNVNSNSVICVKYWS